MQGQRLYEAHCESCHMADGSGLNKLIPTLHADYYENNQDKIACIIRHGIYDSIMVNGQLYYQEMPYFDKLNDFEIVNIINYIDNVLLQKERFLSLEKLRSDLNHCPKSLIQKATTINNNH